MLKTDFDHPQLLVRLRTPELVLPGMTVLLNGKPHIWRKSRMKYHHSTGEYGFPVRDRRFDDIEEYILLLTNFRRGDRKDKVELRIPITELQYGVLKEHTYELKELEILTDAVDFSVLEPWNQVYLLWPNSTKEQIREAKLWQAARRFFYFALSDASPDKKIRNVYDFNIRFRDAYPVLRQLVQGPYMKGAFISKWRRS